MITGLPQIAGSSAGRLRVLGGMHSNALSYCGPGELDTSYRFVEFETNGVSFLVKADFPRLSDSLSASILRLQPMRRRMAKTWSSPISASTCRSV